LAGSQLEGLVAAALWGAVFGEVDAAGVGNLLGEALEHEQCIRDSGSATGYSCFLGLWRFYLDLELNLAFQHFGCIQDFDTDQFACSVQVGKQAGGDCYR
jgi:hypothetical protein